jgi:hypothetical protein
VQERAVREIRMLCVMWRELETELRLFLLGHEGGNSGHGQGAAYRVTAPALDPTAFGISDLPSFSSKFMSLMAINEALRSATHIRLGRGRNAWRCNSAVY